MASCMLAPTAISAAVPSLSLAARVSALNCSAALPTSGRMTNPMKPLCRPSEAPASCTLPATNSAAIATRTVAAASTDRSLDRPRLPMVRGAAVALGRGLGPEEAPVGAQHEQQGEGVDDEEGERDEPADLVESGRCALRPEGEHRRQQQDADREEQ